MTHWSCGRHRKPRGPSQRSCFSESAEPLPPIPHISREETETPPLIRNPSAACYCLPPCSLQPYPVPLTPSLHTTGCLLYSVFQSCFSSVYLEFIFPFLWEFVKREARIGYLMESEGMGEVVGWRWGWVLVPGAERDPDEEGIRGLFGPSTSLGRQGWCLRPGI